MVLSNYNIPFYLYELDKKTDVLTNVATQARINGFRLGGRALVAGPVVSDFRTDLFANNENGGNRFFMPADNGVFAPDSAKARGIADVHETGDREGAEGGGGCAKPACTQIMNSLVLERLHMWRLICLLITKDFHMNIANTRMNKFCDACAQGVARYLPT